jgi:TAG lipase / steryl ester hydrolase / phospholipase A2 / LPA acyltransferase
MHTHHPCSCCNNRAAKAVIAHLPALQQFTTQVIDTVFVPKVIARQLALLIALEAGLFTADQVTQIIQYVASNFSSRSRLIQQLMHEQELSATQDEWMDLAERIDNIQGSDIWRSDPACSLYEQDRIAARIDEYVHLMRRRDIFELMFVLRGGIGRNKFGLLHEDLFSKAIAGSKVLVETYHNVVVRVTWVMRDKSDNKPVHTIFVLV